MTFDRDRWARRWHALGDESLARAVSPQTIALDMAHEAYEEGRADLARVTAERDAARAQLREVAPIVRAVCEWQQFGDAKGRQTEAIAGAWSAADPKMLEGLDDG